MIISSILMNAVCDSMRAGRIVYFLGSEDVHKTTNINFLRRKGKKVKVIYVKTRHFLVRILFKPFVPEYFSHAYEVGTWGSASCKETLSLNLLNSVGNTTFGTSISCYNLYVISYTVICESFLVDTICDLKRDHV